ncbi:hypothetical protein [Actinospongicola halichondriae]|uniref:hypothetical protein n=1 Tax=Actinospongicola halichondriae TaxID=3236844 RepID=UPI003D3721C6
MTITVLDDAETTVDARIDGDAVWISADDLDAAIGWTRKPEGLCRGPVCVPVREPIDGDDGALDLRAVAAALGKQTVFDPAGPVLALADDPMGRGEVRNLHDLALPDCSASDDEGRLVDLSGLAGKKVVLIAWASW